MTCGDVVDCLTSPAVLLITGGLLVAVLIGGGALLRQRARGRTGDVLPLKVTPPSLGGTAAPDTPMAELSIDEAGALDFDKVPPDGTILDKLPPDLPPNSRVRGRRHLRLRPRTVPVLCSALPADASPSQHPIADLFARELTLPRERVDGTIDGVVVEDLLSLGLVEMTPATYAPKARIDHVGPLLLASDLRRHRHAPDFVVGPGPASLLLARHVRPHPRGRLLDMGCGSGIQGLLLGGERAEVVALDINPRAVAYASFNAALNGRRRCRPELGDFLAEWPDRRLDGRFQTVVANPPFVLAPRTEAIYRDRTLPGDDVGARTVERAARALAPDGRGYVLCNWIDRDDGDWFRRPRTWAAATGAYAGSGARGEPQPG